MPWNVRNRVEDTSGWSIRLLKVKLFETMRILPTWPFGNTKNKALQSETLNL
jgi:hypothetical protein